MKNNKLDMSELNGVSGGDLSDDARVLRNAQPPHIHEFFTVDRDASGLRVDKCYVCGLLKYFLADGNEITEMEYKIMKKDLHA